MGDFGAIEAAQHELLASLKLLPKTCAFQVILYDQEPYALTPGGRTGFITPNDLVVDQIARLLQNASPQNGTDHVKAIQEALRREPEMIVLVTDADDLTKADAQRVARANFGKTVIHAIELASTRQRGPAQQGLDELARLTHGSHQVVQLTKPR